MLFYALQIYLDFSAYSDMAIGMGLMVGFHYDENFNYPYISGSIKEFWNRWHISLGTFFRDYVYIPLGGNQTYHQPVNCLGTYRILARSQLELYFLGTVFLPVHLHGEHLSSGKVFPPSALCEPSVCHGRGLLRMGAVPL